LAFGSLPTRLGALTQSNSSHFRIAGVARTHKHQPVKELYLLKYQPLASHRPVVREYGYIDTTLPLPSIGKEERAKSGRKKRARAKLTMEMLVQPSGVNALLESLKHMQFPTTKDAETQRRNLAILMKRYRLWGQSMIPQLSFDQFLVSLEKLASKRDFKDRVDAMLNGADSFSDDLDHADEDVHEDVFIPKQGAVVVMPNLISRAKDTSSQSSQPATTDSTNHEIASAGNADDQFHPSMIDPDDLVETTSSTNKPSSNSKQAELGDEELDELQQIADEIFSD